MKTARVFAIIMFLAFLISSPGAAASSLIAPLVSPDQTQTLQPQDGIPSQIGTMAAPQFIHLSMSSEPPVLTKEQQALLEECDTRGPLPAADPLPVGDTAVQRSNSAADARTATMPINAQQDERPSAPEAPGTFTLFRDVDFGSTIKSQTSGLTGEPVVANSGPIVFATGNWWAAISGNGGQSFDYISPFAMFPASFGGFCCDQKTVYDPSRDIFIWSLQYIASGPAGAGQNLFRIAIAHPKDALHGNWHYFDFPSFSNTEWDFPDLCLSNDFVYYFTNRGTYNAGTVNNSFVFRFPLDPLAENVGFGYNFLDFGANGFSNLSWHCARGARDIVYFASHNTTSQVRIFRWAENTGTLFWDDVNLSAAWPNSTHVCPTLGGLDWCGFDDGRIKAGWVGRNMIGFMWNASAGGGFPVPYVEAVRVREPDRVYVDRPFIWWSDFAYQYPDAAPNARGDVGIVVHGSSATTYPMFFVGIDDDFSRDLGNGPPPWEIAFVRQGTQGPTTNRWGDYFSVHPFAPNGLGWIATGTTMQGCGGAGCKETRYEIFGRERDLRGLQNYFNPIFGIFLPSASKP